MKNWEREFDKFIKIKKDIYNLTNDKVWQQEQFIPDIKQFIEDLLEEQRKELEI